MNSYIRDGLIAGGSLLAGIAGTMAAGRIWDRSKKSKAQRLKNKAAKLATKAHDLRQEAEAAEQAEQD